jgi:hypothetical protein
LDGRSRGVREENDVPAVVTHDRWAIATGPTVESVQILAAV